MNAGHEKNILAENANGFNALSDPIGQDSALMDIAARVERALLPVQPAPAFRARLHDGLTMAAQHRQVHQMLTAKRNEPTWGWIIGAAALGSAAGVIAVVLRSRTQTPKTSVPAQMQN